MEKVKQSVKKWFSHICIDGLTGMAWGLFATLIIGTIIEQIGKLIGENAIGNGLVVIGKICASLTGAGIGIGVAIKYKASAYVTVSAAIAGMIGGFASKILAGNVYENGNIVLIGPGEPMGAFLASFVGIEIGKRITGKTKVDIILVPLATIIIGGSVGLLLGPAISELMTMLGSMINWAVEKQPFIMGILVSVLMGMILTLPISSAALAIILNLNGFFLIISSSTAISKAGRRTPRTLVMVLYLRPSWYSLKNHCLASEGLMSRIFKQPKLSLLTRFKTN